MEVIKITPRGYCKGVVRALEIVKKTIQEYPDQPIHILGMIIHNQFVMDALKEKQVITHENPNLTRLELLDEIDSGVVIFSAHGVSEQVVQKAKEKGLILVNASCEDVISTQRLIQDYLTRGYDIFYIGKKNHPEAEAMISMDLNRIHLISSITDIDQYSIKNEKIMVTTQTTMSLYDVKEIISSLQERFPQIEVLEEICSATRMRQEALFEVDSELLYVVGDPNSNNSKNLARIAKNNVNLEVYFIQSVRDIKLSQLKNKKRVAVTAGASTPTYLTNQVIEFLEQYPNITSLPKIDSTKIL